MIKKRKESKYGLEKITQIESEQKWEWVSHSAILIFWRFELKLKQLL